MKVAELKPLFKDELFVNDILFAIDGALNRHRIAHNVSRQPELSLGDADKQFAESDWNCCSNPLSKDERCPTCNAKY